MEQTDYARYKRCYEWYCVDPDFRAQMDESPRRAVEALGYEDTPNPEQALAAIRWTLFRDPADGDPQLNPYIRAGAARQQRIYQHLSHYHSREGFASAHLYDYEQIIRSRCRMENRLIRQNDFIYYYPMCIELSKGCSVQCSFCGLSAERHQGDFRYTEENRALFRSVVRAAYRHLGPILGCCPLYFATEPFDNPDYERFMVDFRQITGLLPQTTTAIANRDPQRLRRWMETIGPQALQEHAALRLSIRSLEQFHKIAALYTPQELEFVELVANNPQSIHRYSASGRAMEDAQGDRSGAQYSICCLSGLRVNLVERSVSFLEPEVPSGDYPLGYALKQVRTFRDAEEFVRILEEFDGLYFRSQLPREQPLRFNANITLREEGGAFLFLGDGCGYRIGKNHFTQEIVAGIRLNHSFDQIISRLPVSEADGQRLYAAFHELYLRGYLQAGK